MPRKATTQDRLNEAVRCLINSRFDTVGGVNKPMSLVETFWLDEAAKLIKDCGPARCNRRATTQDRLNEAVRCLINSRFDTVGGVNRPMSLVETFWLDEAAKLIKD